MDIEEFLKSEKNHTGNDASWQVIPTEWIVLAQKRWRNQRPSADLTGVGVNVIFGVDSKIVVSKRYGNWFGEFVTRFNVAGYDGDAIANKVMDTLAENGVVENPDYINVNGAGVGSLVYDCLKYVYPQTNSIITAIRSEYYEKSGKYKMYNVKAEMWWKMRESLDPRSGLDICLPPDNELLDDLCSATYKPTLYGIMIESNEKMQWRLGRQSSKADALLLANYCISKSN